MKKTVVFVRHAQSLHNISKQELGVDPLIFDANLSKIGIKQAKEARSFIEDIEFDLIVSSPLSRAIDTCNIMLKKQLRSTSKPILINLLARERITGADDVGNSIYSLKHKYENIIVEHELENDHSIWWHNPHNSKTIEESKLRYLQNPFKEDRKTFYERVEKFKTWLKMRNEKNIIVFSHCDFIERIVGFSLSNAEIVKTVIDENGDKNDKGFPFQVVQSNIYEVENVLRWENEDSEE